MEIGLLLNVVVDLLEKLLVNQRLNATNGEMGNEVLPITEIAEVIEGIKHVGFKVIKRLRSLVHPQPQHPWRSVAAKKPRAIKVHRERLVSLGHLATSFVDSGDIEVFGLPNEFQREVDIIWSAIVDVLFVRQVFLQAIHQSRIFRPAGMCMAKKVLFIVKCLTKYSILVPCAPNRYR